MPDGPWNLADTRDPDYSKTTPGTPTPTETAMPTLDGSGTPTPTATPTDSGTPTPTSGDCDS